MCTKNTANLSNRSTFSKQAFQTPTDVGARKIVTVCKCLKIFFLTFSFIWHKAARETQTGISGRFPKPFSSGLSHTSLNHVFAIEWLSIPVPLRTWQPRRTNKWWRCVFPCLPTTPNSVDTDHASVQPPAFSAEYLVTTLHTRHPLYFNVTSQPARLLN